MNRHFIKNVTNKTCTSFLAVIGLLVFCMSCNDYNNPQSPPKPPPCPEPLVGKPLFSMYKPLLRLDYDELQLFPNEYDEIQDSATGGYIIFAANQQYDTYEWRIGTDSQYWYDSVFTLHFKYDSDGVMPGDTLPVTFIGTRKAKKECPNVRLADTLTRYLIFVPFWTTNILGQYKGANQDSPLDSFTVRLFLFVPYRMNEPESIMIENINRGCPGTVGSPIYDPRFQTTSSFNKLLFSNPTDFNNGCEGPIGRAELQSDRRTIVIDYATGEKKEKKYRFIGTKQ